MTKKEIILQYVAENQKPDQNLCPIIISYWRGKNKDGEWKKEWRSDTGKIVDADANLVYSKYSRDKRIENNPRYNHYNCYRSVSGSYDFVYTKYVPEYKMLEISAVNMISRRYKEGEIGEWTFDNKKGIWFSDEKRLFLFKNDTIPYNIKGEPAFPSSQGKYYNKDFTVWLRNLNHLSIVNVSSKEFYKFADTETYQINRYSNTLSCPYCWGEWYKKTAPRPTSKNQMVINDLLQFKLTDLKELEKKYPLIFIEEEVTRWDGSKYIQREYTSKDFYHFEIINDNYCVIRFLKRPETNRYTINSQVSKHFEEPVRIYIDSKGKATVCRYLSHSKIYQIVSSQVRSNTNYYENITFGNLDEIKNWKRLSWIDNMVQTIEDKNKAALIVDILRHPVIELLYKAGYPLLAKKLMRNHVITADVQEYFQVKEPKKGSITKSLGVNKGILTWIENKLQSYEDDDRREGAYYVLGTIKAIKTLFNTNDISSWSEESINTYCNSMELLLSRYGNWPYYLLPNSGSRWRYSNEDIANTSEEDRNRVKHILRLGKKDAQIMFIYADIISTYKNLHLESRPELDTIYHINNAQDMNRFHDNIVALLNQQRAEERARWNMEAKERLEQDKKKFKQLQDKRREKYNFTTNEDNFLIKVPEDLVEITNEGNTLHHCVGGYVSRHACGETNIIFLRKKELESLPFYTIEVRDNEVIQIHGMCNCHLGRNPEVIPFVIKWLKEKGIKCIKEILLCTSNSYCSNGEYLDAAQFGL